MIIGIGIDLVEVERVSKLLEQYAGRFAKRLFTDLEREYCEKMANPGLHFAARFAAKEAFLKAIGTGLSQSIGWKDVGVRNLPTGEPVLDLQGKALEVMRARNGVRAMVTLSHTQHHACAAVVIDSEALPG